MAEHEWDRWPASTSNSDRVAKSSPLSRTGVRSETASPGDRRQVLALSANPRHDMAIVEAQPQRHPHRHATAHALDDAHHSGGLGA